MLDYNRVFHKVRSWLLDVGALQLKGWETDLTIGCKSNEFDLVTDIDHRSEEYLLTAIRREFPGHAVLSEESGVTAPAAAAAEAGAVSDYCWVVDPLDGTVNYAHKFPLFTISIALRHLNQTVFGAVYVPYLQELFHAVKGQGAFMNGRPIGVAAATELAASLLATGFPYDRATDPDNNLDYFQHMVPLIGGISRTGTAAFDLCNVAGGRINGYWEFKLNLWDAAAGALIVEEAGGRVRYFERQKGVALIAGNERICEAIFEELRKVRPELALLP